MDLPSWGRLSSWGPPVAAVITACALGLLAGRWWRGRRSKVRARRARAGEVGAEQLLRAAGYHILDRQVERTWTIDVDGVATNIGLRADLLVGRNGRRYVAEVKTGAAAPASSTATTRRQLLEYRLAFAGTAGVLLVDMERKQIRRVRFRLSQQRWRPFLLGALAGAVALWSYSHPWWR